jgi:hypothetical protein
VESDPVLAPWIPRDITTTRHVVQSIDLKPSRRNARTLVCVEARAEPRPLVHLVISNRRAMPSVRSESEIFDLKHSNL